VWRSSDVLVLPSVERGFRIRERERKEVGHQRVRRVEPPPLRRP
jgi:hypothetical protein